MGYLNKYTPLSFEEQVPATMKFELKEVYVDRGYNYLRKNDKTRREYRIEREAVLKKYSVEGWDLVTVVAYQSNAHYGMWFYFRREIIQPEGAK